MTFNNSILLILKNSKNIEFNELLSRISSRYKNQSSAYSSLSRALKNLESLGKIKRKNNRIYITDKGMASIQIEMKEKLVLKLNEIMKKPVEHIDEIVQFLIVLTERATESKDLLLNARENATFTISEISNLQEQIEEKKDFLDKMASLLGVQEERLREINFNDEASFEFNEKFIVKVLKFIKDKKVILKTHNKDLLDEIPDLWKKDNLIIVENEFKEKIFGIIIQFPLAEITFYLPNLKIIVERNTAYCFALHKTIKEFSKL